MTIQDQKDVVTEAAGQAITEYQKGNWQLACYHLSVALQASAGVIVSIKKLLYKAVREPHEN